MRILAKRLIAVIPRDVSSVVIEVDSVPAFLDDIGLMETWTLGIRYHGQRQNGEEFKDHIRPFVAGYGGCLAAAIQAYTYFDAIGVKARVVDTKREGTFTPVSQRESFLN